MLRLVLLRWTAILLLAAVVLIVLPDVMAGEVVPPYRMTASELDDALGAAQDTEIPGENVRVLYFHRTPGCATCQKMAKMVYEIIGKSFSAEVRSKQVILRYYDFEDPKNSRLVKAFNVKSPSLILVRTREGKQVSAKYADQIWTLAADRRKFFRYVEKEIRDCLSENTDAMNTDGENGGNR